MRSWIFVTFGLLAACGGSDDPKCADEDRVAVFTDADGDGWGAEPAGRACAVAAGFADREGDCADADEFVHPEARERCNGADDDCDDALDDGLPGRVFFLDSDGDGYGTHGDAITACQAPPGRVLDDTDCDDANGLVSPGGTEVCSEGVDEDCDGLADDADDSVDPSSTSPFFYDKDGDGHGNPDVSRPACEAPAGAAAAGDDCDDDRAEVFPGAVEVCNGRDDDCDGALDHLDDSIDPGLLMPGFADVDADGHGDPNAPIDTCGYRRGIAAADGTDCDDAEASVNPDAREQFCDSVDNDCDAATDDDPDRDLDGVHRCGGDCDDTDGAVHPGAVEQPADGIDGDCDGEEHCFTDADGDGLRNAVAAAAGPDPFCTTGPNRAPSVPVDCDDGDAAIDWSGAWVTDADLDGFGTGAVVLTDCTAQAAGLAPAEREADCDDAEPAAFPGAPEVCNDGLDADCDGGDHCRTCDEWYASDPTLPTTAYTLEPVPGGGTFEVWCDMDADGGGWSLVAASVNVGWGLDNYAAAYQPVLGAPAMNFRSTYGVWDGLRDALPATGDLRFACTDTVGGPAVVDLSFYDVSWYQDVTSSPSLGAACFLDGGTTDVPERRNNVTGETLPASDPYASGTLTGEDSCGAYDDFTVDFDDAGMNGDESDGTDWGMDDFAVKCGVVGAGAAWYVFAR